MAYEQAAPSVPSRDAQGSPLAPRELISLLQSAASSFPPAEHREAVRLIYGWAAERYDGARDLWARSLGRDIEATIDRWLDAYASGARRVLDLGCGTGANLARLIRLGRDDLSYTGVDFSDDMLSVARRRFGMQPGVCFLRMDVEDFEFPDPPFDLILSTYAVSHLKSPAEVLHRALATVAPGGSMVLADFTEPARAMRPLVRPLELWFRFQCIRNPTSAAFRDWREKAIFRGGLMTAWIWTRPMA